MHDIKRGIRYYDRMEIRHWRIPPHLNIEVEVGRLSATAVSAEDLSPLDFARLHIFNRNAPKIAFGDVENLLAFVEKKFLRKRIQGVGIEVGAGPLLFSSVLAKRSSVKKMYGIELSAPIVERIAPAFTKDILGKDEDKVVGVVGSFDAMELQSESGDFVFDFMSLHHATDLGEAFCELYRVLKPGGFVFCFDKARPNRFTPEDTDSLLDIEYSEREKRNMGVPVEKPFTRRMNGEKEYRLKDWQKSMEKAGFLTLDHWRIEKTVSSRRLVHIGKEILALFPATLQCWLTSLAFGDGGRFGGSTRTDASQFEKSNLVFTPLLNCFPRGISLMVAYK